jgi:hypothetical protein
MDLLAARLFAFLKIKCICHLNKEGVMEKILVGLALVLLSAGTVFAAPDAIVFQGGDVRISGTGNGLVFPNGTIQTKAALEGLSIGTVTTGSPAAASITGTTPIQVLNLTIPQGPAGTNPGHVLISPNKNLKISDTLQLVATSFNSSNNQFPTHSYTWTSVNPTIATVNGTGLVTAINAGTAIITVLDTTNNVSGQIAINVISLTGDWISSNAIDHLLSASCPGLSLCTQHSVESQNHTVSVTTSSCKDSCNNDVYITMSGPRNGSSISYSGTLTITPPSGPANTYPLNCLNTWDGNNSSAITCVIPGSNPLVVFDHHYMRN